MPDNYGRMTSSEAPKELQDFCYPKQQKERDDKEMQKANRHRIAASEHIRAAASHERAANLIRANSENSDQAILEAEAATRTARSWS